MSGRSVRRAGAVLMSVALTAALAVNAAAADVEVAAKKRIVKCDGKVATKVGTKGPDVIRGTAKRDIIVGRGGNDVIIGFGGNDLICGGPGDDRIRGNGGIDKLIGGAGRDHLLGGTGPDRLFGGPGPDVLNGGQGADLCQQGLGAGPRIRCELPRPVVPIPPAPPAPPVPVEPTTGTLTIGGPGSDQVGGGFRQRVDPLVVPTWLVAPCSTGMDIGAAVDEFRFAMEFPLTALPVGASVAKATLTAVGDPPRPSGIFGYAGNGSITSADVEVVGTPLPITKTDGLQVTVDATTMFTPAVIASSWAGVTMRDTSPLVGHWQCEPTDPSYPVLTIEWVR